MYEVQKLMRPTSATVSAWMVSQGPEGLVRVWWGE